MNMTAIDRLARPMRELLVQNGVDACKAHLASVVDAISVWGSCVGG
jgi:hypothetical protein